ncbi:MAG: hypothetical protein ABIX10_16400 [Acidimicrobiales bacterium]
MRPIPRAVACALVAILVASCGDSTSPTTSAPPAETTTTTAPEPVNGIVAEIGTNRLYAVDRAFGLALRNVGDEPLTVEQVQLDSGRFASLPITDREVTLQPGGRRFVLPLPYGEVRCDGEPEDVFGVVVVVDHGEELRLDATEEYAGAVARVHTRECAAADVLDRVHITFGDDWASDGMTMSGELTLEQRHSGEPVAIDDAVGNVIFTLHLEQDHPVLRVSDDEPVARLPVTISADRCDPHAVAEFKRPYVFLSWIEVGDAEPVPVELELLGGARQALVDLVAACSV